MSTKLLLHLLSVPSRSRAPDGGFSIVAGIVIAMAIVVGGLALVELSTGRLQGVFASSDSRQARAAAEAGLDQIIGSWNQPENRKMLVSGTAMNTWASTTTGETLRSPCVSNSGTRPGSNSGQPTLQARSFGDGQFRDVGTGVVDSGERRFRLTNVTYATGAPGSNDRRSLRRSTALGSGTITAVGTPPTGNWDQLINLEDPDGASSLVPGDHHGFITLTVTGLVVRNGVVVGTSTVTREFEVLPKCCGASLGSNGSGGSSATGRSLGSDSRYCGVQFGIITGINGGTHWSYFANDRFTSRDSQNRVVNISSILGALKSGETLFQRSNCRVIPTPNNSACNPSQSSTDRGYGTTIGSAGAGGVYGTNADIAGTTISGIPMVPINLSALPSVNTIYKFPWPTSGWVDNRVVVAGSGFGGSDSSFVTLTSTGTTYRYFVRTNPGAIPRSRTNPPKVEVCQVTTTTSCGSWSNVSDFRIADNFSNNYLGGISDLNLSPPSEFAGWAGNGWSGNWLENESPSSATGGVVRITSSGSNRFVRIRPTVSGARTIGSISRGVDIQGYIGTKVRADISYTGLEFNTTCATNPTLTDCINFAYSTNNGSSWSTVLPTTAFPTSGSNQNATNVSYTFNLPPAANAAPTNGATTALIRFQLTANDQNEDFSITNVEIAPSGGLDSWCAYTASAPVTGQPGFMCLGPQFNLGAGGSVIADTSGGPLTFYYNAATDTRATDLAFNATTGTFGYTSPLVSTNNGATIQHVVCPIGGTAASPSLNNNCLTPVSENVYSAVGEPDRLNFFGRDTGATQAINIGSLSGSSTAPGKISGAWFYFPQGDLTLTVNGCTDGSQPSDFYANDNGWNFSGRIWVKNFKPCGAFHFRVPPSNLTNIGSLFGTVTFPGDVSFVDWSGVDWVARATTNVKLF